jgi:hypothetical protein
MTLVGTRPHQGRPAVVTIEVEHAVVARLRVEAARREVPVKSLIRDLLDVIAADQLTGAILDDGAPAEPPPP